MQCENYLPGRFRGKQHRPFFTISQFFCRYVVKFSALPYPFNALGGNTVICVKWSKA